MVAVVDAVVAVLWWVVAVVIVDLVFLVVL